MKNTWVIVIWLTSSFFCVAASGSESETLVSIFAWENEIATKMARSPDGRFAAVVSKPAKDRLDNSLVIRLVDIEQKQVLQTSKLASTVATSLCISDGGDRIAVTTYDVHSGNSALFSCSRAEPSPAAMLEVKAPIVLLAARLVDKRGFTCLSASTDASTNAVKLIQASNNHDIALFRSNDSLWWSPFAISDDNRLLAVGRNDGDRRNLYAIKLIQVGEMPAVSTLAAEGPKAKLIAFSRDNSYLASCSISGAVRIWELKTNTLHSAFSIQSKENSECAIQFSVDGTRVAVAVDGNIELRRVSDGHRLATAAVSTPIYSIEFATGGHDILIGSCTTEDDMKMQSTVYRWRP